MFKDLKKPAMSRLFYFWNLRTRQGYMIKNLHGLIYDNLEFIFV